jgi:hypothetical protein
MNIDKVLKNVLGSIAVSSEYPFVSRKSAAVFPLVLGAVGVAIVGGLAAVMIFSPRTRTRALDMGKGVASKVQGKIGQISQTGAFGIGQTADRITQPNGLASDHTIGDYGTTSGL